MANLVLMPQIGISEESAILAKWYVKAGDTVSVGAPLFSSETGKSAFDVACEFDGVVLGLLVEEGEEVLIKAPVCAIGAAGESFDAGAAAGTPQAAPEAAASAATAAAATAASATVSATATAFAAAPAASSAATAQEATGSASGVSPRARALAAKADVNPALATPTGPEGRVIERDVRVLMESGLGKGPAQAAPAAQAAAAQEAQAPALAAPAGVAFADKPLSTMRKIIAKNMMASLSTTAQLTHTASFDATAIQQYRAFCKEDALLSGVTLTDMILFAVTRTLPEFPALNAWLQGDTLRTFAEVNLACAVDTERGLMVPVMFGASGKSLLTLSNELKALAAGCRDGSIAPELLTGGSFTVSNLGMFGTESFTPILNAPQTGILGVNTITTRVRDLDGKLTPYPCMTLSLTYDHRALDGAPASKFLQTLCKKLERFPALLAL